MQTAAKTPRRTCRRHMQPGWRQSEIASGMHGSRWPPWTHIGEQTDKRRLMSQMIPVDDVCTILRCSTWDAVWILSQINTGLAQACMPLGCAAFSQRCCAWSTRPKLIPMTLSESRDDSLLCGCRVSTQMKVPLGGAPVYAPAVPQCIPVDAIDHTAVAAARRLSDARLREAR